VNKPFNLKFLILIIFTLLLGSFFYSIAGDFSTIAKIKACEIWPSPFDPISRFVTNIDWETRKVTLDGSISKAYKNAIKEYDYGIAERSWDFIRYKFLIS